MIEITRSLARQLKTIFRRAITESGRGVVNQPVLLHAGSDGLRIRIASHEAAAEYHDPSLREPDAVYIPFDLLKDCEAKNDDVVQVEMAAGDRLLATWNDHHVPQMKQYDIPSRETFFPDWPDAFTDNPPDLAGALHAAMETASPESTRYSLNCVQLQGTGSIVATDASQMLLQSGFEFPWEEDLLIPRRLVFASSELLRGTNVQVGRSDGWVWFRIGCWSFAFAINEEGRFPPVESNIPDAKHAAASIQIDSKDADFLVKSMKQLPGNNDGNSPVTVDANGSVVVRSKSEDAPHPVELLLAIVMVPPGSCFLSPTVCGLRSCPGKDLGRVNRSLAYRRTVLPSPVFCLFWAEEISGGVAIQEWLDRSLGFWTKGNQLLLATPTVLVVGWLVDSDIPTGVDIARTHHDDFAWTHPRKALNQNHRNDLGSQEWQRCRDIEVGDRSHGLSFMCLGTTILQTSNSLEAMVDRRRDQLFSYHPFENPFDPAHAVVNVRSGQTVIRHLLANRLERLGAKVGGQCAAE